MDIHLAEIPPYIVGVTNRAIIIIITTNFRHPGLDSQVQKGHSCSCIKTGYTGYTGLQGGNDLVWYTVCLPTYPYSFSKTVLILPYRFDACVVFAALCWWAASRQGGCVSWQRISNTNMHTMQCKYQLSSFVFIKENYFISFCRNAPEEYMLTPIISGSADIVVYTIKWLDVCMSTICESS